MILHCIENSTDNLTSSQSYINQALLEIELPHSLKPPQIKSSGSSDFLYTDTSIRVEFFRLPHTNRKTDLVMI